MDKVLRTRAVTALFFVIIVVAALLSGRLGASIFMSLVLMMTTYELVKMSSKKDFNGRLYGIINLFIFFISLYISVGGIAWIFASIAVITHLVLIFFVLKARTKLLTHISKNLWLVYPLLSFLAYAFILQNNPNAHLLLLILLMLIWVCDSAAYLVGRKIGKRKLFERVSPNKTIEGALGSLVLTPLFALLIPFIFSEFASSIGLIAWVVIGLIVAVFGTLGDLYQSQIKRIFGVKDSGRIMPGHGGIWDRFDSFIYLLPF
ncbi:MAG TPA: phosphatidate cytidylyltransferase, partial [Saprospiraceae bacterium]|nr:phosphatidate cytidylyltransferase [Saprospiraceae bacterium]